MWYNEKVSELLFCACFRFKESMWDYTTVYWPDFSNLRFESCVNSRYSKTDPGRYDLDGSLRAV